MNIVLVFCDVQQEIVISVGSIQNSIWTPLCIFIKHIPDTCFSKGRCLGSIGIVSRYQEKLSQQSQFVFYLENKSQELSRIKEFLES